MRMPLIAVIFSSLAVAVLAGPAEAAGLPQLDASKFAPQVIWLVISFVALYILMARGLLPKIAQVLEERQNRIDDNLGKAETLKAEAETAAETFEAAMAEALAKGHDVVTEVRNRVSEESSQRNAELSEAIAERTQQAEANIAAAKAKALESIRDVAVEAAAAAAAKLSGGPVDDQAIAAAVDGSLKETK